MENVIFIFTAGYPDSCVKEFLHMLCMADNLKDTPFLYFGDHDGAGFQIFQSLKMGSKTSAWVSPISICPRLEYVGPTLGDLKSSPGLYMPQWTAQYILEHPHASDAEVSKAAESWQKQTDRKINSKCWTPKGKEKGRLPAIKNLGWLQYEPRVKKEILLMTKRKGASFRFANLAESSTAYVRFFIEEKVLEYSTEREVVPQVVVTHASPRAIRFREAESQTQVTDVQQEVVLEEAFNEASQTIVAADTQLDTLPTLSREKIDEALLLEDDW